MSLQGQNLCPGCNKPFLATDSVTMIGSEYVHLACVCDVCGGITRVGDWPFCGGDPTKHVPAEHFGEEPLEAYDDFNLGPGTVRVTTRGERRKLMAAANLEYVPKEKRVGETLYFDMKRG